MKHNLFFIFGSLLLICLITSNCKKHKTTADPVSQLPPVTQVGANTFGCLVDGQVFVPKGSLFSSPSLQCAYQYLDNSSSKGFYFQLSAKHQYSSQNIEGVAIGTENLKINDGEFILGDSFKENKAFGMYTKYTDVGNLKLYTQDNASGRLVITRFDEVNQIVSGTFWFSVVVNPGDTVKITDGRFDMQFTK